MNAIEKIKQIVELRAKATPGPWNLGSYTSAVLFGPNEDGTGIEFDNHNDPPFIALAGSTDWPALLAEVERLQAIVDKLPKTKDGVPVSEGSSLFGTFGGEVLEYIAYVDANSSYPITCLYSTREAAEAAARKDGDQ